MMTDSFPSIFCKILAAGFVTVLLLIPAVSVLDARPNGRDISAENSVLSDQPCFVSGCHNAPGGTFNEQGSVTLNGLPSAFVPGQTYDLTLNITGGPAQAFGFQVAAVFADGTQAGTLVAVTPLVTTVIYSGVNVLTHSTRLSSGIINFQWQAPAAPAADVTFRFVSNSADNDGSNFGDAINFRTETISPAQPTFIFPQYAEGVFEGVPNRSRIILTNNSDAAAGGRIVFRDPAGGLRQVPIGGQLTDSLSFSLTGWGTLDIQTDGTSQTVQTGPIEVFIESGDGASVSGTEIFDLLGNFVSVPGSKPANTHQVYVSVNAEENTGVALYNPDTAGVAILELILLDEQGVEKDRKSLTVSARRQLAVFVNESQLFQDFFATAGAGFKGTLNISTTGGPSIAVLGLIQKSSGALLAVPATNKAFTGS